MDPLLVVIVSFGLIFTVTAALATGLSVTAAGVSAPLKAHRQLNIMMVISNFIILPALLIGLTALLPFEPQVKMAIAALALNAGAPFIPWLVSLAKGNLPYSVAIVPVLTILTIIVLPLALPPVLNALDTNADINTWIVLWPLLLFILLPMVVGIIIRATTPKLAMAGMVYLGPLSITFLMVHIILFLGYTWQDVLGIGWTVAAFALVLPLGGMLVGYLLSPPYVLSPMKPADPHRGGKIVSSVSVAQQNTGAAICVAIFAFSPFTVAGDYILIGALTTIVVVMVVMAFLGSRLDKKAGTAVPAAEAPMLAMGVHRVEPAPAAAAPAMPAAATVAAPVPAAPAAPATPTTSTGSTTTAPHQHAQGDH